VLDCAIPVASLCKNVGPKPFCQAKNQHVLTFLHPKFVVWCTSGGVALRNYIFSLNLMFIAHVLQMTCHCCCCCCVRCCNRLSVRYISYVMYIVNYMWLDSLYMSLCGVILFVGWFCLVEPTIIIPPPLLSTPTLGFVF
jgi:hypothetical protein